MQETTSFPELDSERDVLDFVLRDVAERFPSPWDVVTMVEPQMGRNRPDGLLRVTAPDGSTAQVVVEAKLNLEPKALAYTLDQVRRLSTSIEMPAGQPGPAVLVVARYLAPRTREMLAERGASYADATGNVRVSLDTPAVFIQTTGASANPWRTERETRTLRGTPAARVIRALCDWRPPQPALAIADRAATSVGSVYRTLDFLDREALITRRGKGLVLDVDVSTTLRRWSQDYDFLRRNKTVTFIEPRGGEKLLERLRDETSFNYAVTGSLAAATVSEYATPELLTVYVDDIDEAGSALSLRAAATGANVMLAEPFDPVVYARSTVRDGVKYCALSQVVADLLSGPGRNPAEAEELMRWMETNERVWRL